MVAFFFGWFLNSECSRGFKDSKASAEAPIRNWRRERSGEKCGKHGILLIRHIIRQNFVRRTKTENQHIHIYLFRIILYWRKHIDLWTYFPGYSSNNAQLVLVVVIYSFTFKEKKNNKRAKFPWNKRSLCLYLYISWKCKLLVCNRKQMGKNDSNPRHWVVQGAALYLIL